jgi:hypothetical protein
VTTCPPSVVLIWHILRRQRRIQHVEVES